MSKHNQFLVEARTKSINDLKSEIVKRYDELRDLRFNLGFAKLGSLKRIRSIKKEIARLFTILGEKLDQEQENK